MPARILRALRCIFSLVAHGEPHLAFSRRVVVRTSSTVVAQCIAPHHRCNSSCAQCIGRVGGGVVHSLATASSAIASITAR